MFFHTVLLDAKIVIVLEFFWEFCSKTLDQCMTKQTDGCWSCEKDILIEYCSL